ncbi:hybrid sensor histidine kinase/response regulator [Polaromonas sp.]|uniref:hybrid sensor histidine kinase/response regulator n=1 Tax=Polaromonas sp. TaxID=1869339 RepID=UPI0017B64647|nr:hybrid sensor histidine kinase/response regulator [Polaromonas sp.]NMM07543.1 HAMP domain-containing histidine kinase [Polaromonas sp.]
MPLTPLPPISQASPASSASQDASVILFVDDEPQARKWFARSFSDEFSILTVGSVDEALRTLRERGPEIAVLVTDYRMPSRDGLALLITAQREHRHVVRLLATAYAEKDVAIAAINQGRVLRILEKPFDDLQVREALREALAIYRRREREHFLVEGRAAAMRETLGFLAHELNTPLATVLGYMEELKRRTCAPAPDELPGIARIAENRAGDTRTMIEAAERRTLYALSLVATFVQSARDAYPGAAPAPLRASRLVSALLDEYPFEGDERAWVSCDMAADFELPGQPDLLYLVLCSLTKNALLALRGGPHPSLHITLEQISAPDRALQSIIRFTDNGPGIAPEIFARLTREPVTTRAAQGGSGMGLLFCRRVVQSMGGLMEVQSELGRGASVALLFNSDANLGGAEL